MQTKPNLLKVKTRSSLSALVRLGRPKQWTKNLLVIGAALAAGAITRDDVWEKTGVAFVSFCLLSSGIYALNDVRDRNEDRAHPTKRKRPVASGQISPAIATVAGVLAIAAGLALSDLVSPLLVLTADAYVILTLSYTLLIRHIVVLDLLAVAGGFVLRAVAGGVAASVPLSASFLVVVSCAALMITAGKRDSELSRVRDSDRPRRLVLRLYTHGILRMLMLLAFAGGLVAYVLWALQQGHGVEFPWRLLTAVPFAIAMGRYLMLVRSGDGEAPDELLLSDRPLIGAAGAWLTIFALGVSAGA